MGRGKALTSYEQGQIAAFASQGFSQRRIAQEIGRAQNAVCHYLKDPENYGKRYKKGRPCILKPRDQRRLFRAAGPGDLSSAKLVDKLNLPVSRRTVSRILTSSGIFKYVKMNKAPRLKQRHKDARVAWGEKYANTTDDVWARTFFSDEKKWNLDGPDGLKCYWYCPRNDPKVAFSRQNGGGSVMVWGAFFANGKTEIAFLDGNQCAEDYVQTLKKYLLPVMRRKFRRRGIFQQDNASIHTARVTKSFFQESNLTVMDWPALSPDLNPIENVWGLLAQRVYGFGKQYDTVDDLKTAIRAAWEGLDPVYLSNLVAGMKKRCLDVYRSKGEPIGK